MKDTTKKGKSKNTTIKEKLKFEDVSVGDILLYNDGAEKLTVTVTKINTAKKEMDVKWKTRETWLLPSDFTNGYVKRLRSAVKQIKK